MPDDDFAEGGFASAVSADEAGFLLAVKRDTRPIKDDARAEAFVNVFDLQNGRHLRGASLGLSDDGVKNLYHLRKLFRYPGSRMDSYDAVIIGAGAAGMMCALSAGKRGRRVALLEHAKVIGRKIRISGGGRCNFTNTWAAPEQYVSENPHFCRSALSRYTPEDFLQLVRAHGIAYYEKKLGQQFCKESAQQIIDMLLAECHQAGARLVLGCKVRKVEKAEKFIVKTSEGDFASDKLVIATGGLSLPTVGATGFGYAIARQFGLCVVETAPALDAFVFDAQDFRKFEGLAGVSLPARLSCNGAVFVEQVLFTHTGLSGPAALQASLYWRPGSAVHADWLPNLSGSQALEWFSQMKASRPKAKADTLLAELLPKRVAERFCEFAQVPDKSLADQTAAALENLCRKLKDWQFTPKATVGYRVAEVTRGGVDASELSSKTMESKKVPGLYFIGEVVDVTGWLGGYNFQWAWSSGWACSQSL